MDTDSVRNDVRPKNSPPGQNDKQKPPAPAPAPAPLALIPADWYYDMSGDKLMLIFNHYEFHKPGQFVDEEPETRVGTHHDVNALELTFSRLGFQVTPHQDKTQLEILDILRELCERDHRNTSCVCVCVLTHGWYDGELYAADKTYETKDLLNILHFGAPGLVDKPKLLIVQACRGGVSDPGQAVQLDGAAGPVIPSQANTLVLRASVEDYISWREDYGSWLIRELCRVVDATHHLLDVQQMVAIVTSLVSQHESHTPDEPDSHRMKQVPETRSTLTKLLRLSPPPRPRTGS